MISWWMKERLVITILRVMLAMTMCDDYTMRMLKETRDYLSILRRQLLSILLVERIANGSYWLGMISRLCLITVNLTGNRYMIMSEPMVLFLCIDTPDISIMDLSFSVMYALMAEKSYELFVSLVDMNLLNLSIFFLLSSRLLDVLVIMEEIGWKCDATIHTGDGGILDSIVFALMIMTAVHSCVGTSGRSSAD
jgi:hypothetical protein